MTTEEKRCPFCRRLWDESEPGVCSSCGGREQAYNSQRLLTMPPLLRFGRSIAILCLLEGLAMWGMGQVLPYLGMTPPPYAFGVAMGLWGAIVIELIVRRIRRGERGVEQVYSTLPPHTQRFLEMTPLLRFGRSVALLGLLAGLMIWVTERGFQYLGSTTEPFHFTWVTIGLFGVFGAIATEVMIRQIRWGEHDPEQDLAEIFSVLCSGKVSDCQTTREQATHE